MGTDNIPHAEQSLLLDDHNQAIDTINTSSEEQTRLLDKIIENDKKQTGRTMKIIWIILVLSTIGVLMLVVFRSFSGPFVFEYQRYLDSKYGSNENFSYIKNDVCSMFNAGFCVKMFSSEKGGEFAVRYDGNMGYSDNYYLVKYRDDFRNYYYEKYGKYFKDAIPYDYIINVDTLYPYFGASRGNGSFDDVLFDIEEKKASHRSSLKVVIDVNYMEIDLDGIENINFDQMKSQVRNALEDNKNFVDVDKIQFKITMAGSGRTGLCPNGLDTYKNDGYYVTKNLEGEIKSCVKTLYPGF